MRISQVDDELAGSDPANRRDLWPRPPSFSSVRRNRPTSDFRRSDRANRGNSPVERGETGLPILTRENGKRGREDSYLPVEARPGGGGSILESPWGPPARSSRTASRSRFLRPQFQPKLLAQLVYRVHTDIPARAVYVKRPVDGVSHVPYLEVTRWR